MNFCTLYPEGNKGDLFRDPGQIPYNLAKNFPDIVSSFVACDIPMENALPRVNRFSTTKITRWLNNNLLTGLIYLACHARDIDWLNLYHCRRQTLLLSRAYKLLNKRGKVYVKLDAGFQTLHKLENDKEYLNVFRKIISVVDVVSAESSAAVDGINELVERKIKKIPNGAFLENDNNEIARKNIFLTVARIGSPEKKDDLLMEAFARIADQCDWNLKLVGPIDRRFNEYTDSYFKRYPFLKDRVIFTGNIDSRKDLSSLYRESKIFVLPSEYESFSLACIEAMQNGCYVILSDQVTPYKEFTNDLKYGVIFEMGNVDDLSRKMIATSKINLNKEFAGEISDYATENFTWDKICTDLYSILRDY